MTFSDKNFSILGGVEEQYLKIFVGINLINRKNKFFCYTIFRFLALSWSVRTFALAKNTYLEVWTVALTLAANKALFQAAFNI